MTQPADPNYNINQPPPEANNTWVFSISLTREEWCKLCFCLRGQTRSSSEPLPAESAMWLVTADIMIRLRTILGLKSRIVDCPIGRQICEIDEHAPDYVKQNSGLPESIFPDFNPASGPKAQVLHFYTYRQFVAGEAPPTQEQMDGLMEKLNMLDAGHPHEARWWMEDTD